MPKHVLEAPFKAGAYAAAYGVNTPPVQLVTSGAWKLKQYVAGEKTVLEPNPYWYAVDPQKQRLPYLDELVFLEVPDQDAADLKFRSGQLDGLDNVKPENYQWYADNQQQGNFTFYDLGPALSSNFFWFNLNTVKSAGKGKTVGDPVIDPVKYGWFNNVTFRRAVSMAVDRDAMIPSIFFGDGSKNWSTLSASAKLWHSPDVPKYDFNLDEAKALLAGLGWKDTNGDGFIEDTKGQTVSFTLKTNSDNKMRVGMANFVRDDLAKVGIKVTLVPVDFNTLITNVRDDLQYNAGIPRLPDRRAARPRHGAERLAIERTLAQLERQPGQTGDAGGSQNRCVDGHDRLEPRPRGAPAGVEGRADDREPAGVAHLAADHQRQASDAQPFRQRQAIDHPASPDLEHRPGVREEVGPGRG
ncbi:MAG: ABC transporter substrate-binding protein [Vicinamibacterales bacterium]